MSRPIDADELVEELRDLYKWRKWNYKEVHFSLEDVENNIRSMPTIDVRTVVRCKDCKFFDGHNYCEDNEDLTTPDWFCAGGDRREDATD